MVNLCMKYFTVYYHKIYYVPSLLPSVVRVGCHQREVSPVIVESV